MKIRKDISGKIFMYLTAIRPSHKIGSRTYWLCQCKCGNQKRVSISKLINGEVRSCGCYKIEKAKFDSTTHGLSGHPLLIKWKEMIKRCYNHKIKSYKSYGGRGVTVCDEWRNDFMSFYNWSISNGWEQGLQIDKDIKGNGLLYSPETCLFVTPKENSNKRRSSHFITYKGETQTLMYWSEKYKINKTTILGRIKRGWTLEETFTISTIKTGKTKCSH